MSQADPGFDLPPAAGWRDSVRLSGEAVSDRVTTEQAQAHLAEAMCDAIKVERRCEHCGVGEGYLHKADCPRVGPEMHNGATDSSLTQPAIKTGPGPFDVSVATPDGKTASIRMVQGDAHPHTDYYAGVADKRRAPKPEASPADYWSGAARNPRRWWQVWRKK